MGKRASKVARFNSIGQYFGMFKGGINSEEETQKQIKYGLEYGHFIYESELEKLATELDEDQDELRKFLEHFGALKLPGRKTGTGGRQTRLDTEDKARDVGVADVDIPLYIDLVHQLMAVKDQLQEITPLGRWTLSCPIRKKDSEAEATEPVDEQAQ